MDRSIVIVVSAGIRLSPKLIGIRKPMFAPCLRASRFALVTLPLAAIATLSCYGQFALAQQDPQSGVKPPRPTVADVATDSGTGEDASDPIADKTEGMTRIEGFQTFYWDDKNGKIWFEIDRFGEEFLYVTGLAAGLGSNPVGLDRGQVGDNVVVQFRRVGSRVFMEQRNLKFRASTENAQERQAVADSFASSIIWSADVAAENDGKVLVDGSTLLMRDAHQVTRKLSRSNQGSFSLDLKRSYMYMDRTKGFPDNSEFEVVLTYASSSPGPHVRETTPSPNSVTLRQHHSFVRLPDADYRPRRFDPRVGGFAISYSDYSVPLDESMHHRYITRHRLEKKDPSADMSEPIEPIIYYVDNGAPEPVRSALVEGASWWNDAFESAGFKNGFQVRVLPADADPMDVRYNVIQWVHRSTRGWSYGQSVTDPRTGEIIKGHVLLGSLRVRQDRLIFEGLNGLTSASTGGFCNACQAGGIESFSPLFGLDDEQAAVDVALARIRQLSAHEVGHTIGFSHNFAASTYGDRASVMDYPAPRIGIRDDGSFDLSDAYGVGIGEWDHTSVVYAYSQFADGVDEDAELERIAIDAQNQGQLYLSDSDARHPASAEPRANLWDNGTEPVAELRHLNRVRELALSRFGDRQLADGQPMSDLEQVFVPIYLINRYQVEAVAKMIGGVEYRYAVQGETSPPMSVLPAARQREAMIALLETLEPSFLAVPSSIRDRIPPKPYSSLADIEKFSGRTTMLFDPLAAAETSANWTLQCILQTQRLNRLVTYDQMQIEEVLGLLQSQVWLRELSEDRQEATILRSVQDATLRHLFRVCADSNAHPDVVAVTRAQLGKLRNELMVRAELEENSLMIAHHRWTMERIDRFLADGEMEDFFPEANDLPPGSPIGAAGARD